jgi:molybdate-binding protein/transcriptional regulator with XRE-family HTH domain
MSHTRQQPNRVNSRRLERGWTQAELARRAGISRAAVSAIEINRLVPSVAAGLGLAMALECTVEDLFGSPDSRPDGLPVWAWTPPKTPCRFWHAQVGRQTLLYPVETTPAGVLGHDGVWRDGVLHTRSRFSAEQTLVLACCDPAGGLLAAEFHRLTGMRIVVLPRSSQQAVSLLEKGLVHVAGIHLATPKRPNNNRQLVLERMGGGYSLLRVARWQEGLALSPAAEARSVREALRAKLRWIGRQPGSGARQCQDELLENRSPPRRTALDHRGVAEAIRSGWADAGVCLQLVSEEIGLRFFTVREEIYELCFATMYENDPRIRGLTETIRAASYSKLLTELPGYSASECGELARVN